METLTLDHKIKKETFPVEGMSCASCASSVESILSHTEGVNKASVNLATNSVLVEYNEATPSSNLKAALQSVGFDLIIDAENREEAQEEVKQKHYQQVKFRLIWSAIFTIPIVVIGMFFMDWEPGKYVSLALAIPVLFYFGRSFFINSWKQAKHAKANMDTLVALSTGIAFLFSVFNTFFPEFWLSHGIPPHVYYEAAVVIITFISLGKLLEERAKSSTSTAIKKLMGLQPKTVRVIIDGSEQEIAISEVKTGYTLIVKPGEKIAVDGTVSKGSSYVDESMITGEPVPVVKEKDQKVFAGTVNQKGSFQFTAEKVGKETLLSQIIKLVQEAQGSKAPVQKLTDKIASIFVPTIIAISLITFITWMILGQQDAFTHALLTSIAVLVIACPCALGLATPTAIMVGVGKGAQNNILIKDAESLEMAHKVNAVILDKTGTITQGKPTVADIRWENEVEASILLAIESQSEHPLASAVVNHLKEDQVTSAMITDFESITGKGVKAKAENGQTYYVGSQRLINELGIALESSLETSIDQWQNGAKTVIFFADEQQILAVITITDQIKVSSASAIERLKDMGLEVFMLTGDNQQTAQTVARQVGVTDFKAEVLPSEKADFVKELQQKGKIVAMVGDGINDSHALAQADVSIAMGHGSDIAMDVAKMTLITSDLEYIPKALKLSDKTVKGIRQNLFWAFIYNLIGIPIAAGLLYPINGFLLDPMIAGAAMAFSSVSVVLNSLRLNSIKL
ncbi:heavy metal translocating P-type ATPase [Fulvivirga sediminis]|uniref:P-type Cu(+) transporter n=1 Tax=Fulvivirga sediminis TaxID=2803949 RepID=A0A937FB89_9BACT|nr:heavy metal translocating P-type ATPase [Fulvivirga sediminis]MBL3657649.1 copper-translocating P-type ATPase [Fulvivirga sediminis]